MATDLLARIYCGILCDYAADGEAEAIQGVFSNFGPTMISFGTGAGKANLFWSDERTIAASGDHTIDLQGSLTNKLGETAAFADITAIFIEASTANADLHNLVVGAAASNQWLGFLGGATDTLVLVPGARFCLDLTPGGGGIVNATNDNLKFANAGISSSIAYTIAILGESV